MYHNDCACLRNTQFPETLARLPPPRNSPRIIAIIAEESRQHFIVIEQAILCQVPTFFTSTIHPFLFIQCISFTLSIPTSVFFSFYKTTSLCILILLTGVVATDINRYVKNAWEVKMVFHSLSFTFHFHMCFSQSSILYSHCIFMWFALSKLNIWFEGKKSVIS